MIYFTSDLHFGHEKIISFCNRPFGCVKEMDDTLIANWNATVTKNDVVYILGDFAFYKEQDKIEELWNSLNGIKHWIIGNHDNNGQLNNLYKLGRIFKPKSYDELKYNKRKFILFHYPIEFWNKGY
ncbi:MAG: metallophosphoesterase, partial [Bacteroidetes bacterium]|nr:metallophosphoesterase [Bacteroidota bacterium]